MKNIRSIINEELAKGNDVIITDGDYTMERMFGSGWTVVGEWGWNSTEEEVDAGTEGEICISGPTVMLGYMDNPEETAQTLRRHVDGRIWLHTGDLGYMDGDGFIYFRQRIKRMLITSGYNVYPTQLENIIDGHEKVLLSCVVGVRDAQRGQRIKAYIVPMPGIEPNEKLKAEILEYCKQHISKYALPREVEFRTELPKTISGKIMRNKL